MTAPNEMPPPPGAGPAAAAPPPPAQPAGGGLNVGAILQRLLAHLPVTLVVLVLGVSITMVLARSRKPTYSSETVIRYSEGISRQYIGVDGEGDQLKALPARLKETLLSRAHLEQIIKEFNLYPQIILAEGYIAGVDRFRTKIVFKPRTTETFQIGFEGSSADEAQQVTARLAAVLIEDMTERKKARAKTTIEFLENAKKKADEDLAMRETELARFMAEHPEFATETNAEQGGSGVRAEKIKATADPGLLALDRQAQRLRTALGATRGGARGAVGVAAGPAGEIVDPALVAAKNQADQAVAVAQKDLDDKSEKLTDQHPDVKQARSRLAEAQTRAREAASALTAVAAPQPVVAVPKAQEDPYEVKPTDERARLQSELMKNEREMQALKRGIKPDATAADSANQIINLETEFRSVNREREKARTRQGDIDARLFKAQSNAASELGGYNAQVAVLDPAFLPIQPGNMGKTKFMIAGIVVSILLGLVMAAAWGVLLDDRVFVADDLAAFAPVLAVIPKVQVEKKGSRRA